MAEQTLGLRLGLLELPGRLDHLPERELYALGRNARFICELEAIWKKIDRRRALGEVKKS